MPNIYGYGRASTDAQKPSLARQEKGIKAFVQAQKLAGLLHQSYVYAGFYEDEDVSGGSFFRTRPAGMIVNNALKSGDILIATNFDRLFRKTEDCAGCMDDFRQRNIRVIIMDFQVDTSTANGQFFLHVMAAMKEAERHHIVERITSGIRFRRSMCSIHLAPTGWKGVANNKIVPNYAERKLSEQIADTAFRNSAKSTLSVKAICHGKIPESRSISGTQLVERIVRFLFDFPLVGTSEFTKLWTPYGETFGKKSKRSTALRTVKRQKLMWIAKKQGKWNPDPDPAVVTKSKLKELADVRDMKKNKRA